MAAALNGRWVRVLGCLAALWVCAACTAPWSRSNGRAANPIVAREPSPTIGEATPSATRAPVNLPPATSTPVISTPTATPLPTAAARSPSTPARTPAPPVIASGVVSSCCGIFAWAGPDNLLVYDVPKGSQPGSYLVNAETGARQYLAPHFGLPNGGGLVAVSRPDVGQTDVLRLDGSVVATIKN